jgi:hypothetical protein
MRTPASAFFVFWLTMAFSIFSGIGEAGSEEPAVGPSPVVVELFTSQGCSSCPPADALLGELAQRPNIVALALHVDYWDYIGWKDPFASPALTRRQRDYADALGLRMVYTPQMVVDGRIDVVGSHRSEVESAIVESAARPKLAVRIEDDGRGGHRVVIPAGDSSEEATVWLAVLDSEQETRVGRGENSGRTLKEFNIVREWRRIGSWNGSAIMLPLEATPGEDRNACAVVVQSGATGPVLGAAYMRLGDGNS